MSTPPSNPEFGTPQAESRKEDKPQEGAENESDVKSKDDDKKPDESSSQSEHIPILDSDTDEEFESKENFFFEEEEVTGENAKTMKECQEAVEKARMVPWSNFEEELCSFFKNKYEFDLTKEIMSKIQKFAEATCLIIRKTSCDARINMQKDRVAEAKKKLDQCKDGCSTESLKTCEERVDRRKKKLYRYQENKGGCGTGFLIGPENWKVITNNHVLMEGEEKDAQVIFNFVEDGNNKACKKFEVEKIVSASPPTKDSDDTGSYDYSYVELKVSAKEKKFITEKWILADQSLLRIQWASAGRKKEYPNLPMLMFSHPHSLARRLSLGHFPENIKSESKKIKHDLPTTHGCSGAALVYPQVAPLPFKSFDPAPLKSWKVAFVHYRHGNAFLMKTIGDNIIKNRS